MGWVLWYGDPDPCWGCMDWDLGMENSHLEYDVQVWCVSHTNLYVHVFRSV